ncbi:MAG: hypothetical protein J0L75_15915 [Spirochaetes bacterium]|nr:hypothetical protein [Spirochaetota bacterium]
MSPSPSPAPGRLAWWHFAFDLPADWEATGYATRRDTGRFHFHSREAFQGQLSWRPAAAQPDIPKILFESWRAERRRSDPAEAARLTSLPTQRIGPFTVVHRDRDEPCFAGAYNYATHTLVEWIFPAYSKTRLAQDWTPLFHSFALNDGKWREWSVYGIRAFLPAEFSVEGLAPYPANVRLDFSDGKKRRLSLHRWGIPAHLLSGRPLPPFHRSTLGKRVKVVEAVESPMGRHPGSRMRFRLVGSKGFNKLLGRWWHGQSDLWHDTEERRLYALTQTGPRPGDFLEVGDVFPSLKS